MIRRLLAVVILLGASTVASAQHRVLYEYVTYTHAYPEVPTMKIEIRNDYYAMPLPATIVHAHLNTAVAPVAQPLAQQVMAPQAIQQYPLGLQYVYPYQPYQYPQYRR